MFLKPFGSLDLEFPSGGSGSSAEQTARGPAGYLWLRGSIGTRDRCAVLTDVVPENSADADWLLAALGHVGPPILGRLPGIFAGVWQAGDRVMLFRDAMGLEPLHFRTIGETLHVHSDARPLARLTSGPLLDEDWLATYLMLAPEEPFATPFADVSRIPPGHAVTFVRGRPVSVDRHWAPSFDPIDTDFDTAVETSGAMLDEAMRPYHGSPLMLSAGVDSNVMASRLRHTNALADAITGSPSPHADPVGSAVGDEYPLAHVAYEKLGGAGRHHRLCAAPSGLREAIGWAFDAFERPVYNPSNSGWVDGCHALAAGLGASHLFEGTIGNFTLGHDGEHPMVALAAAGQWRTFASEAVRRRGRGVRLAWRNAPPTWWSRATAPADVRARARQGLLDAGHPSVARARRRAARRGQRLNRPVDGYAFPERRLHEIILQLDLAPPRRAALRRHGIELVDPYADPRLVEYSLRLPDHLYRQGSDIRCVQRALLDPRLPDVIRRGRVNGLQGTDWRAAAIRDAGLMRAVIARLRDGHRGAGIFDVESIDRMFRRWPASGWDNWDQLLTYRVHLMRALTGAAFAQWVADQ